MNAIETFATNSFARAIFQDLVGATVLLRLGGRMAGGTALEIGCGRGAGTRIILERFGASRVIGIDLDPAQVERARAQLEPDLGDRVELRTGDAERLDLPDASIDAVFDFAVIHHVPDWRAAIAEVARVLKPGGILYFEELLRELVMSRPFQALFDHPPEGQFHGYELFGALRAAGLGLVGEPLVVPRAYVLGVARKPPATGEA